MSGYKALSYQTETGNGLIFNQGETPRAINGQIVVNTPEGGYELPSTSGIGTTLFTALGGLMTATAGAMLMVKSYCRRRENA
ncbi:MAG: LPXTG cell wall anchor domain-containing protein [Oscillospiraceae bacterium]|nr:LPXTG cell wall anchor domain-containing protein [Oscillospiraceae bacterium]